MKKAFRRFIGNYFLFTRGERISFFVLASVTLIISLLPIIYFRNNHPVQTDFSLIKNLEACHPKDTSGTDISRVSDNFQEFPERVKIRHRFLFNPNDATSGQLESLGFKPYLAERLIKFRNAGGKFYIKSDLGKIYGISPDFVNDLMPYIDLPESRDRVVNSVAPKSNETRYQIPALININTADTTVLKSLPGIGSKLSQRIIGFREKLGGYYSIEQLSEVYGLKPEVIASIKPRISLEMTPFKLIDINLSSAEELGVHPYIKKNLAAIIVNYRTQHGSFSSIDDLLKIKVLDEKDFLRIKNYLKT